MPPSQESSLHLHPIDTFWETSQPTQEQFYTKANRNAKSFRKMSLHLMHEYKSAG